VIESAEQLEPAFNRDGVKIYLGDCREILKRLPERSVNCCVTSPPYFGLRDYGCDGQIGLEATPVEFVAEMVSVFREVKRVLRDDGVCWLNLGDSYCGYKGDQYGIAKGNLTARTPVAVDGRFETGTPQTSGVKNKDLIGIPWMVAFALRADGWYLRQDIIWHKPNPMPESVTDRCTKSHEYMFLLTKSDRYFFNSDAIKEDAVCGHLPGNNSHKGETAYAEGDSKHRTKAGLVNYAKKVRESAAKGSFNGKTEAMADTGQNAFRAVVDKRNKRSVWTVSVKPYKGAHFATFPADLIRPCVAAGCPEGGTVLDPFTGSGTTAEVAKANGCKFIGCELNPEYLKLAADRFKQRSLSFVE
jgi:DNA modification methylase